MTDLPEPLTPPDCDLRGYTWMPVDVQRLLTSETWVLGTAEEKVAAFTLWAAAWSQVPAGSLPSEDLMLAHLSQAGAGWKKVRQHALRGWIKCSDGRLYHKVVAEKESFDSRQAQKQRTEAARNARLAKRVTQPPDASVPTTTEPVTSSVADSVTENVTGSRVQESTGEDKEREAAKPLAAFSDSRNPQPVRDAMTRIVNPSPNDPPTAWMHLADRLPDGTAKVELLDIVPGLGNPICGGMQLNVAAGLLCVAAGLGLDWRGDWRLLINWLRDGLDFHDVILPAVQRVASRPSYQTPSTLRYFESAVREAAGRMRA